MLSLIASPVLWSCVGRGGKEGPWPPRIFTHNTDS